jgi:DNA-binding protein H-NS
MTNGALEKLSLDELWSLHEQVCALLEQKMGTEKRKLDARLAELGRKSADMPVATPQRGPYPKVEAKFRNPEDSSETWSGRGKKPKWITELLATSRAVDEFRILEDAP